MKSADAFGHLPKGPWHSKGRVSLEYPSARVWGMTLLLLVIASFDPEPTNTKMRSEHIYIYVYTYIYIYVYTYIYIHIYIYVWFSIIQHQKPWLTKASMDDRQLMLEVHCIGWSFSLNPQASAGKDTKGHAPHSVASQWQENSQKHSKTTQLSCPVISKSACRRGLRWSCGWSVWLTCWFTYPAAFCMPPHPALV